MPVRGLLAPQVLSPFRKTRSGQAFSPWTRNIGTPLHVPVDFSLEKALKTALDAAKAAHADTSFADQSAPPTTDAVSDHPPVHPEDPDEPVLASATLPPDDDGPVHPNRIQSLFNGFTRSGLNLDLKTGTGVAPHSPRTSLSPLAPIPKDTRERPADNPSARSASLDAAATARTKKQRANHRSKAHRRERRSAQQPKEALLYPDGKGRSLKGAALRQIQFAVTLIADANLDHVLARDNQALASEASSSAPIQTDLSLSRDDLPLTASAYVARLYQQSAQDRRPITRDEACSLPGFQYVKWDGKVCRPVLDADDKVITLLCGQPNDPSYEAVNEELGMIFRILASSYRFARARKPNRRGNFETISCGISYGGGQKRVGNFALSHHNQELWRIVLTLKAIRRVANYADTSMRIFFPNLSAYYHGTLASLCFRDKTLKRNFDDNGFAAISINLGPHAVAYVHTDHLNLAYGLCAITAVGDYDPRFGGHLILWDLGLIIEFPPGSTILIPSAILRHSNTALAHPEERRYAFLQYSAGGLFRWADCDFQSQKSFLAAGNSMKYAGREHWEKGLAMFSRWEDLKERLREKATSG